MEGLGAMISRKKLIEVALPLEAINKASAREQSIRHGIREFGIRGTGYLITLDTRWPST